MNSEFAVRSMRPGELELVLEWARQEGWNPGLDDSLAFLEADPSGFFVGSIGEVPVGSISVVKYGESFAFLGLYIVHPDFRGKGYGKAIWETGVASAGDRTIGLDGVAAQQDNYRKAGFEPAYSTIRYGGVATSLPVSTLVAQPVLDSRLERPRSAMIRRSFRSRGMPSSPPGAPAARAAVRRWCARAARSAVTARSAAATRATRSARSLPMMPTAPRRCLPN